jgi:hypothetical protein
MFMRGSVCEVMSERGSSIRVLFDSRLPPRLSSQVRRAKQTHLASFDEKECAVIGQQCIRCSGLKRTNPEVADRSLLRFFFFLFDGENGFLDIIGGDLSLSRGCLFSRSAHARRNVDSCVWLDFGIIDCKPTMIEGIMKMKKRNPYEYDKVTSLRDRDSPNSR